jgi:hypothetical protein
MAEQKTQQADSRDQAKQALQRSLDRQDNGGSSR